MNEVIHPAKSPAEATELNILASSQLHDILTGDTEVEVATFEGYGKVPSIRKALYEMATYKTPISWEEGGVENDLTQPHVYGSYVYVPTTTPAPMGVSPDDIHWKLYLQNIADASSDKGFNYYREEIGENPKQTFVLPFEYSTEEIGNKTVSNLFIFIIHPDGTSDKVDVTTIEYKEDKRTLVLPYFVQNVDIEFYAETLATFAIVGDIKEQTKEYRDGAKEFRDESEGFRDDTEIIKNTTLFEVAEKIKKLEMSPVHVGTLLESTNNMPLPGTVPVNVKQKFLLGTYPQLEKWVKKGEYLSTEAEWDSIAGNQEGSCGKYAITDTHIILPCYKHYRAAAQPGVVGKEVGGWESIAVGSGSNSIAVAYQLPCIKVADVAINAAQVDLMAVADQVAEINGNKVDRSELPNFDLLPSGAVQEVRFTTTGSQTYTMPPNSRTALIAVIGGGGGGGGVNASNNSGNPNGGNGGSSSFDSLLSSTGGNGGIGSKNSNSSGGSGGIASGYNLGIYPRINGGSGSGGSGGSGGRLPQFLNLTNAGRGGNGSYEWHRASGGGGAGGFGSGIYTVVPGKNYTVTVGAGGAGGYGGGIRGQKGYPGCVVLYLFI